MNWRYKLVVDVMSRSALFYVFKYHAIQQDPSNIDSTWRGRKKIDTFLQLSYLRGSKLKIKINF